MNIIYICCFLLSLPFINFSSFLWLLIIFILVIFHLLIQLLSFFCSTSASNNTSEDTPLNNILKDVIPEIPSCFEGLEEQWADLNKNGRDFRKEIWFKTHINQAKKENITPLEHLADFLRRAYQKKEEDLQEEDLSGEDNEDSNYQEFELCLTDRTRTPSTNKFKQKSSF
ncbi:hypothetical protein RhiirA5_465877 [Rhizophagus irregularis]|uniref:Uncharacterized protein n=3 Tax=Rhizophagus irregularis TaxID=588596 RepID=A0A2N0PYH2_9GLOM|nr:hypothetical protein GLOIN_2v1545757 [Rhizophagus irregularis DAOM 181602=DAOM 197198]EXX76185.1 hypothetical protein RirG_035610 [Rhizophagus irregularis DAOM 197198w]PKC11881.1 hypothetical protein RhiirA5_465877 [Rhizophagus irregularis]PKC60358.1 hypothetical protein RhiirA1_399243 [Rhizophagus irregularis]POG77583.1 hypothetical protein GLOIN_2v1545757 [Rhizophagus irregularis DAOM 181602=DAOM 197198]UZO18817.1 hypothetical protein OCT59_010126 [Rhizophagus irregularis]|eukprot:XP_025184449.1 hypothetical protein GLOIN_2v1545757 [Rhizophagus irregularis DAOM 181602=DAOM 197198]